MSQETIKPNTQPKAVPEKKYSKAAFLSAAKSTKERLVVTVVLQEDATYTKAEAEKLIANWTKKGVE